jgi:hypothetical protein
MDTQTGAVATRSLTENLGETAGLLAAEALMIDYILNAAGGRSAGVEALTSAFPRLLPHTLALCLLILALLTLINIRGTKDTGVAFLIAQYLNFQYRSIHSREPLTPDAGKQEASDLDLILAHSNGSIGDFRVTRRISETETGGAGSRLIFARD